jgi:hypothetical protein
MVVGSHLSGSLGCHATGNEATVIDPHGLVHGPLDGTAQEIVHIAVEVHCAAGLQPGEAAESTCRPMPEATTGRVLLKTNSWVKEFAAVAVPCP